MIPFIAGFAVASVTLKTTLDTIDHNTSQTIEKLDAIYFQLYDKPSSIHQPLTSQQKQWVMKYWNNTKTSFITYNELANTWNGTIGSIAKYTLTIVF